MEGSSKKEKVLMDMDNSVVIAGGQGEEGLRGTNGSEKSKIKKKEK